MMRGTPFLTFCLGRLGSPVCDGRATCLASAVGAAKDLVSRFHAMTNDPAITVSASWSQGLDGALEAVEDMVSIV
jgi:hypothetical protein